MPMQLLWPWLLFASLLAFELGLLLASKFIGPRHVDSWLFKHRDIMPIPFLAIGLFSRLSAGASLSNGYIWLYELAGILLIAAGESLRIWAIGIVGAATRSGSVNARELAQNGPYALTRNPIYLGNLLLCVGLACLGLSLEAMLACVIYFAVVYRRIIRAEELFLGATFGSRYSNFIKSVPQFIPHLKQFQAAMRGPFSWQGLRKEYQTICGIVCAGLILHIAALQPWQGRATKPGSSTHRQPLIQSQSVTQAAHASKTTSIGINGTRTSAQAGVSSEDSSSAKPSTASALHYDSHAALLGRNIALWVADQLPGVIASTGVFTLAYLSSDPRYSAGDEFHELIPVIAGAGCLALIERLTMFDPANIFIGWPSLDGRKKLWFLEPEWEKEQGRAFFGITMRRRF